MEPSSPMAARASVCAAEQVAVQADQRLVALCEPAADHAGDGQACHQQQDHGGAGHGLGHEDPSV
jgi:hypothetical protein